MIFGGLKAHALWVHLLSLSFPVPHILDCQPLSTWESQVYLYCLFHWFLLMYVGLYWPLLVPTPLVSCIWICICLWICLWICLVQFSGHCQLVPRLRALFPAATAEVPLEPSTASWAWGWFRAKPPSDASQVFPGPFLPIKKFTELVKTLHSFKE